jgi:hypothetical protein
MNNSEALEALSALRFNLHNSASPNMRRAIDNQAPIAALVYGLALIDAMAGFFYGSEARREARRLGKSREGVGIRYDKFIEQYLSPAKSSCDYSKLDFYKSMRCNMAHSLTPGHQTRGAFDFELCQNAASGHGATKSGRTVVFDVPIFCDDVLQAVETFLNDVELSLEDNPEPLIVQNFKSWCDEGYSILVSDDLEVT